MVRKLMILIAVTVIGCSEDDQVFCDLYIGYAIVSGVAMDISGRRMAGVDVEFSVSPTTTCELTHTYFGARGTTDTSGAYEVLLEGGNVTGMWCVFGNVVGSDSVSSGQIEFVSDCPTPKPRRTLELDLVYLPTN